uniref:Protein-tyrosine-phosphatase n=1 Tax=Calcidiscus leptoporus TaxID=127549 RepID=A0A7S0NT14_9EUKA|mmetsp:Transcript_2283/g.5186  ORF Transcript_2283/g.5186 Transcript_2283/m.5186 type:complete len:281 (+) Transcript_2283:89-931(+)
MSLSLALPLLVVLASLGKTVLSWLMAPLWFLDAVDKEKVITSIPYSYRRALLKATFIPTLYWTMLLHRCMPEQRRWYDRIDERVIIGALPLKRQLAALAHVERVTGVINFCDEFRGHQEYSGCAIRQLRLPTLDYCSPTAQQLENGLDFIRKQPAGGSVYVHCKAGRGRAGTMAMAYLIVEKGFTPLEAQRELQRVRPHVSPRLWKRPTVREIHRRTQQRLLMQRGPPMPIAPSVSAPFAAATTPLAAATTDAHAAADALSAASLPAAPPPLEVASEDMK